MAGRKQIQEGKDKHRAHAVFFCKGPSGASYMVSVVAQNGRPKVVEFNGGWQLGATRPGLILTRADSETSYEIPGVEGITAAEWDKKGLHEAQIEAAAVYLRVLRQRLGTVASIEC